MTGFAINRSAWVATFAAGCVCAWAGTAGAAVIPIAGSGTAIGSQGTTFSRMFDAQPATDPAAGVVGTGDGTGYDGNATNPWYNSDIRTAYVDFGENWATISITDTFELTYDQYGDKAETGSGHTYNWSPDTAINDANQIAAPQFGFQAASGLDGKQRWIHRYSGPAVTPQARYLLVTQGTGSGNRSQEWVFVGSAVPEPASVALLGFGGVMALSRKRRR